MPQQVSYLLPQNPDRSTDFFNCLLKLSTKEIVMLLQAYAVDRHSIKLVVKDGQISSLKVRGRTISKISSLKEVHVDLYATLPDNGDQKPAKCIPIGTIDRRLNCVRSKVPLPGKRVDMERMSDKFKAIELLAQHDKSVTPSDLSPLLNDGLQPSTIRRIYSEIVGKCEGENGKESRLLPKCLLDVMMGQNGNRLGKYMDKMGYSKNNPFRMIATGDTDGLDMKIKEHKQVKPQLKTPPVSKRVSNDSKITRSGSESRRTSISSKGTSRRASGVFRRSPSNSKSPSSRTVSPPHLAPYPQLRPLPPMKKKIGRKRADIGEEPVKKKRKLKEEERGGRSCQASSSSSSRSGSVKTARSTPSTSYEENEDKPVDPGYVRDLILRFQDTYRRYYKLYDMLKHVELRDDEKAVTRFNSSMKRLLTLQKELETCRHHIEQIYKE